MRLNLKVVLVLLCLAVFLFTLSIWTHCGDLTLARGFLPKWDRRYDGKKAAFDLIVAHRLTDISFADDNSQSIQSVDCVINQEYSVACVQDGDEVYVPFSFIRDYFEVFGSLSTVGKGPPKFEWSHSNAKINYPKGTYDPKGIFMYFENYNVEVCSILLLKLLFDSDFAFFDVAMPDWHYQCHYLSSKNVTLPSSWFTAKGKMHFPPSGDFLFILKT